MVSNRVPCNNGKDWQYIVDYQVDGETIKPLFIMTPTNTFSYGESQYDKNSAYKISVNVSGVPEWVLYYKNIWSEVELQLFENLATESIEGEGKNMHGKLKHSKNAFKLIFMVKKFHTACIAMDQQC